MKQANFLKFFQRRSRLAIAAALVAGFMALRPTPVRAQDLETQLYGQNLDHVSTLNHYIANVTIGGITGGLFGAGASFLAYDAKSTDSQKTALGVLAGGGAAAGITLGVVATIVDQNRKQQFRYSFHMWRAGWYGMFGGAIVGGGIGLISHYSGGATTLEDPYIYGGYGILIGVPVALVTFILLEEDQNLEHGTTGGGQQSSLSAPRPLFTWGLGTRREAWRVAHRQIVEDRTEVNFLRRF